MHVKWIQGPILGLAFLVGLSACGGDGDTPVQSPTTPSIASAEGLWNGTIGAGRTVSWFVLDDGVYWALYSEPSNPSIIAGIVQGDSSSQNGAFTSANATDFNLANGILPATINGSYFVKQSLSGQIAYLGGPSTFTTTYDNVYDLTPDINAVAGTYNGSVTPTETVTVTVLPNKTISGKSNTGCEFSGIFSPRAHGNAFNITVTFGDQAACSNRNDTVSGIGFYDARIQQLYSAALNSARTDGFVFIGKKS